MLFGSDRIEWIQSSKHSIRSHWSDSNNETGEGGNVMVRECVSRLSMGPLRRIKGIMKKFLHEDILKNTIHPYACNFLGYGFIFQQDNDPKQQSKPIKNWLSTVDSL
ncbi:transposable element Tcb2 transposase [Trichonephila clavata]|uniref:Transposable element Tcb2 transposase n=1 Tax=Trichonephila clavata TaxID=2740835 RepID=A0A8X6J1G6_TRICU|nr:transposable element Tcb2 transposase [Trichonephila clavata]